MRHESVKERSTVWIKKSNVVWEIATLVALKPVFKGCEEQPFKNGFGRLEKSFPL
jgi:alanyl-tRNA synthetase